MAKLVPYRKFFARFARFARLALTLARLVVYRRTMRDGCVNCRPRQCAVPSCGFPGWTKARDPEPGARSGRCGEFGLAPSRGSALRGSARLRARPSQTKSNLVNRIRPMEGSVGLEPRPPIRGRSKPLKAGQTYSRPFKHSQALTNAVGLSQTWSRFFEVCCSSGSE